MIQTPMRLVGIGRLNLAQQSPIIYPSRCRMRFARIASVQCIGKTKTSTRDDGVTVRQSTRGAVQSWYRADAQPFDRNDVLLVRRYNPTKPQKGLTFSTFFVGSGDCCRDFCWMDQEMIADHTQQHLGPPSSSFQQFEWRMLGMRWEDKRVAWPFRSSLLPAV